MSLLALLCCAFIVGALIGCVGVGGILLIPALALTLGLPTHQAMATALFSFLFTGILGTWLYQRKGSIDWSISIPVAVGAFLGGFPGALANAHASGRFLDSLLGVLIILAGLYAIAPFKTVPKKRDQFKAGTIVLLFVLGLTVGFGAGLTGVGGPVLSVPLMVILGFAPLCSIATSQVIQITAAISGSLSNFQHGFIDFGVAMPVIVLELFGSALGAYLAHQVSQSILKKIVGFVCIILGGLIFCRSLFFFPAPTL